MPDIERNGIGHIEVLQLFVDQISKDRISDFTCSFLKSYLVDYTMVHAERLDIPTASVQLEVYRYDRRRTETETVTIPKNPVDGKPMLLVPKRCSAPCRGSRSTTTTRKSPSPTVRRHVKKTPNDALSAFKLGLVNGLLRRANAVLDDGERPIADFTEFSNEALPSTSDAVLVIAQYLIALENFRAKRIGEDSIGQWYWLTDDRKHIAETYNTRS